MNDCLVERSRRQRTRHKCSGRAIHFVARHVRPRQGVKVCQREQEGSGSPVAAEAALGTPPIRIPSPGQPSHQLPQCHSTCFSSRLSSSSGMTSERALMPSMLCGPRTNSTANRELSLAVQWQSTGACIHNSDLYSNPILSLHRIADSGAVPSRGEGRVLGCCTILCRIVPLCVFCAGSLWPPHRPGWPASPLPATTEARTPRDATQHNSGPMRFRVQV